MGATVVLGHSAALEGVGEGRAGLVDRVAAAEVPAGVGAHNVVANAGADFRSGDPVDNEGETFTHTFENGGMNTYYCSPHEDLGMKGAVAVGEDVETETIETGGGGPQVPDAAKSLGVAAGFAMAATLGLAYFFIKYGGDYGGADTA